MMFAKKRLELIIESPAFKRACRVLEDAGVSGYTALPCMGGYGAGKRWQRGTDLSATRDMIVIISILDEDLLPKVIEQVNNLIGAHIGIISVSDVEVIRDDKF
ncbi:DUF190 domain-containing protein [Litorimonas sp. RW-G-Af-16]|uniref:DUF190 domain-containing protein n=1 Tax=Litorimonas sp. RW-G-Af-16 TaxID=3241168 RepID=UPI00390C6E74